MCILQSSLITLAQHVYTDLASEGHLRKLLRNELGTQVLRRSVARVLQVLGINAVAVGGVTDTITLSNPPLALSKIPLDLTKKVQIKGARGTYIDTNILRLRDPVAGDAAGAEGREAVDVPGCGAAVVVDVAGEAGLVVRVADEEDALDGVEGGAGQLGQGVDGGGRALRVAFQDEAFVRVRAERALDFVDDLSKGKGVLAFSGPPLALWTFLLYSGSRTSCVPAAEFWLNPAA